MEPIHHRAVVGYWDAQPGEAQEYHPFSGYGRSNGIYYPTAAPWRGTSYIPHHVAVESREDGERNGRIYYDPRPGQVARKKQEMQRARQPFRMDARHAALGQNPPAQTVIGLPELRINGVVFPRSRPAETPARTGELVGAGSN